MHDCHIERDLSERGLRKTRDRHRILELFDEPRPWTVAQIHARLKGMDLSTTYRNIQKLVDEGLIVSVHGHESEHQYERSDRPHHDHKLCTSCKATECIPCPAPTLADHILELIGRCKACHT